MKVILADYSGFCFGVEKAITKAFEELEKKTDNENIYSLGPLIHNDQVVKDLEDKGIKVVKHINDIFRGTVIIRSHGVPEEIYKIANKKGLKLVDATCPFVRRIQNIVKEYYNKGYTIVIIGNPMHPEVIGINGWCNNKAIIINDEKDLKKLTDTNKLCIVAQTTISINQYEKITEKLQDYTNNVVKFNTICLATQERQSAAQKLAQEVEGMIVVGGYHSSNTQKLVSICKEIKPYSTYHVETAEDLPLELFKQYKVMGVTAGASTPKWIINEVIHKLINI